MREKIDNLIAKPPMKDTEHRVGAFTFKSPTVDWVELRNQILTVISEEIEKGLLTNEELRSLGRTTCDGSMIHLAQRIAQAQLSKVLALFSEVGK